MKNNPLFSTLTLAEADVLRLLLDNPMLSNKEIAGLCRVTPHTINTQVHAIYKKLIPIGLYDEIHQTKRRLYILLHYGDRFPTMPESWRAALIDPEFDTKRKS